jgi:biotin carboxyl carrier protein
MLMKATAVHRSFATTPSTAGQGVLVLEAMKMENEIRAEHEGTVTKIHVQPGQAVDLGNPLFELE